jgi:transcriptional regulator with XRE-family HTH domain
MVDISNRIKLLRHSIGYSQEQLAVSLATTQSAINRYENGQSNIPLTLLRRYADFFDVSLDYIFARTDKPQGATFAFSPETTPEKEEMRRFIDMCFDPNSPLNGKLKEALFRMMEGTQQ